MHFAVILTLSLLVTRSVLGATLNNLPVEMLQVIVRQLDSFRELDAFASTSKLHQETVTDAMQYDIHVQNKTFYADYIRNPAVKRKILELVNTIEVTQERRDYILNGKRYISEESLIQWMIFLSDDKYHWPWMKSTISRPRSKIVLQYVDPPLPQIRQFPKSSIVRAIKQQKSQILSILVQRGFYRYLEQDPFFNPNELCVILASSGVDSHVDRCDPSLLAVGFARGGYLNRLRELPMEVQLERDVFMEACLNQHLQMVEYLLEMGSQLDDNHVLSDLLSSGASDALFHLVRVARASDYVTLESLLLAAARTNRVNLVRDLIFTFPVTRLDSALMEAANYAHYELVEFLLSRTDGFHNYIHDFSAETRLTVLCVAAVDGMLDIVRILAQTDLRPLLEDPINTKKKLNWAKKIASERHFNEIVQVIQSLLTQLSNFNKVN